MSVALNEPRRVPRLRCPACGTSLSLNRFERCGEAVTSKDVIFQQFRGRGNIKTIETWSYAQAPKQDLVRSIVLRWVQKLERVLAGLRVLVETPSFHMPGRGSARVRIETPTLWLSPQTTYKFGRHE